ncbi:MAG: PP2C family protein-serine/threonine phosphatase [Deltaproteobacteria bacterium]|nr:PP2C family protein-serine/threonine phosphatase [Deltaproteobacteria bacterium]
MKKFQDHMDFWINRLSHTGGLSSDDQELQLRKAVLILLAGTCSVLGVLWALAYFSLGLPAAGIIPLGYSVVSTISLLYFFRSKKYKLFCRGQLALILILPFFLQWHLGGFAASGAVILWSLLAPIGALMFAGTTRAVPWFLAYGILMIISSMVGGKTGSQVILPPAAVIVSFLMNIGGVSAIVFFLLKYFVRGREEAMAELDQEHRRVRHSLSLAMEVQQNLLPNNDPQIAGLDISGKSKYCDETGGDYYDFLEAGDSANGKIGIVIGDVSDHGIPSALLMATVRAQIRQRCSASGNIGHVVADVNSRLAHDVKESGRFMTLFYAEIDRPRGIIRWVNAGHDPAVLFDPAKNAFRELNGGSNLALGVMEDSQYTEAQHEITSGQILVMATDGVWEARNSEGEMYGKDRLHQVIRENTSAAAAEIQTAVFESVRRFRSNVPLEDDMTLVVVKVI